MDVKYNPAMLPNGSVNNVNQPAVGEGAVAVVPRYKECRRNHAASMGVHTVDGCGEYIASLEVNPADPSTFICVVCGCHRNFHRMLMVKQSSPPPPPPQQQPQVALLPAPPMAASVLHGLPQHGEETPKDLIPAADGDDSESDSESSEDDDGRSVSPPQQQQQPPPPTHLPAPVAQQPPAYFSSSPQPRMMLSPNSTVPPMAAQRLPVQVSPATAPSAHVGGAPPRKRFRTMFTPEQKQRMRELSDRLGWRLQKRDEAIVEEWCGGIGVSKGVFKVWMHNNKHNYVGGRSARRSASVSSSVATTPTTPASAGPFHISHVTGAPPPPQPFIPSVTRSSPVPTATGFNINGTAATATPTFTAVHQVNGTSSPQSA